MEPHQALGVRIVELPRCQVAMAAGDELQEFDRWWSEVDKQRVDKFYPRDFMYHDSAKNQLVWLYALPPEAIDTCPYALIDFAGGLYAVAVSVDQDDVDGERVYQMIQEWIKNTDYFELDESPDRPSLFHVITSKSARAKMNYGQLDIYVPIR
jgi:hypothetical protein